MRSSEWWVRWARADGGGVLALFEKRLLGELARPRRRCLQTLRHSGWWRRPIISSSRSRGALGPCEAGVPVLACGERAESNGLNGHERGARPEAGMINQGKMNHDRDRPRHREEPTWQQAMLVSSTNLHDSQPQRRRAKRRHVRLRHILLTLALHIPGVVTRQLKMLVWTSMRLQSPALVTVTHMAEMMTTTYPPSKQAVAKSLLPATTIRDESTAMFLHSAQKAVRVTMPSTGLVPV